MNHAQEWMGLVENNPTRTDLVGHAVAIVSARLWDIIPFIKEFSGKQHLFADDREITDFYHKLVEEAALLRAWKVRHASN